MDGDISGISGALKLFYLDLTKFQAQGLFVARYCPYWFVEEFWYGDLLCSCLRISLQPQIVFQLWRHILNHTAMRAFHQPLCLCGERLPRDTESRKSQKSFKLTWKKGFDFFSNPGWKCGGVFLHFKRYLSFKHLQAPSSSSEFFLLAIKMIWWKQPGCTPISFPFCNPVTPAFIVGRTESSG